MLLNEQHIRQHIELDAISQLPIDVVQTIPSTHHYFKNQNRYGTLPHICIAEEQTQGMGQHGKSWHSPFAKNIYFTALWPFPGELQKLQGLSLVVGLITATTLTRCGVRQGLAVKWPNDVYHQGRKLAGILIDTETESNQILATISIGININLDATTAISQPWTSLKQIIGENQDRNKVTAMLIAQLYNDLSRFAQEGLSGFLSAWFQHDYLLGKSITLKNAQGEHTGVSEGIDKLGRLLLRAHDGAITAYSAGQIVKS